MSGVPLAGTNGDEALELEAGAGGAVNPWRASLRAAYGIWYRDLLHLWRDRGLLVVMLIQPLFYLVIFGTGLSSSLAAGMAVSLGPVSYLAFIFPGMIGATVLFTAVASGASIVWDREFGFLKEVMVAPIDWSAIVAGKVAGGATQAAVPSMILLALAPLVGIRLTPLSVLELVALVACLSLGLSALAVAVASRQRSFQSFQGVMNLLLMPLFFLAGTLFPLQRLPLWMDVLAWVNPLAYGIDPIRRVVLRGSGVPDRALDTLSLRVAGQTLPTSVEVGIMVVFGVTLLVIATINFRRID